MRILIMLLCFFLAAPAWAGPFGTEMGDTPEKFADLKKRETQRGEMYTTVNPPQKHAAFVSYYLIFYDSVGLARVMATTRAYTDDAYGTAVKSAYGTLKAQLTEKYGKPECVESLNTGSIWNQPQYFTTSINKNEREHKSLWLDALPDNLESVTLEVQTLDNSTTYVRLNYAYKNMKEVREKAKAANQDAL